MKRLTVGLAGIGMLASGAIADGLPQTTAAPAGIGIDWEVGARFWYSTGHYKKDLFDSVQNSVLNSRLTYAELTGQSAEAFFRGNIPGGLFVKGIVGGGSITGGKMNDEDFPPLAVPIYSNTLSQQRDGNMSYFNADVGYNFLNHRGVGWEHRVGAFVGYGYWRERLNTFGCDQLNPPAVNLSCHLLGSSFNGLDNDATWRMVRLGVAGDTRFGQWKLAGEAAYVYGRADAMDWHNQRPDIRGLREDATGGGVQLEAVVSYFLTPSFSVGAGARYWHISGDGNSHFEDKFGGNPGPIKLESERYGVFVQGSLAFGGETVAMASIKDDSNRYRTPPSWTGAYWGLNVGYGTSSSFQDINGVSPLGVALAANGYIGREAFSNVDTRGFFGGAQAGYNLQIGRGVVGIEADLSWTHDSGSTGSLPTASILLGVPMLTSADQAIESLATVRARAGYLASPHMLLYVTGGLALGETRLSLNVRDEGLNTPCGPATVICSRGTSSGLSVGYAVGGGLEYKLSEGVSLKGEYLYVDLGSRSVTTIDTGASAVGGTPATFKARSDFDANLFRVGINFDLNRPAPPLK